MFTDTTRNINWTSLPDGDYYYNVTVNDTMGHVNYTATRTITLLSSCLGLSGCAEDSNCVVDADCVLHSGLCTGGICQFANFTINASMYSLYDSVDGRNLVMNISDKILFLTGNKIEFSGKNGTQGGDAGILNITTQAGKLFNTTSGVIVGRGGYSSAGGNVGGNGGIFQMNYWGKIRNFTDSSSITVTAGDSLDSGYGANGTIVMNRDTTTTPRDVDVTDNGIVNGGDLIQIRNNYNKQLGDVGYSVNYDINADSNLNIKDIYKIGFEYLTR